MSTETTQRFHSALKTRNRIEALLAPITTPWCLDYSPIDVTPLDPDETRIVFTVWIDRAPLHLAWQRSQYSTYIFIHWMGEYGDEIKRLDLKDLDAYLDMHGVNVLLCSLEAETLRECKSTLVFSEPMYGLTELARRDEKSPGGKRSRAADGEVALNEELRFLAEPSAYLAHIGPIRRAWARTSQWVYEYTYASDTLVWASMGMVSLVIGAILFPLSPDASLAFLTPVVIAVLFIALDFWDARRRYGQWRRKRSNVSWRWRDRPAHDEVQL